MEGTINQQEITSDASINEQSKPRQWWSQWWIFGCLLALLFILLLITYLNVPADFVEKWAGKDRLPHYSYKVSTLYREALHAPRIGLSTVTFYAPHLILNLLLWPCYFLAIRYIRTRCREVEFWTITLALIVIAILIPPLFSTDVFYYGITGQIAGVYGSNPYIHFLGEFPNSRLMSYNYWVAFTSPYGTLWTDISAGLAKVIPDSPLAISLAFKIFAAVCVALSALLIRFITRRIAPDCSLQATALFAWNPLVLYEAAGNAHNDALVMVLAIAALATVLWRLPIPGFLLLTASSVVKITSLPLVALFAIARVNTGSTISRVVRLALYAAAFITLFALSFYPWWQGPDTLKGLAGQSLKTIQGVIPASVATIASLIDHDLYEPVAVVVSAIGLVAVGLWTLQMMWRFWRLGERLKIREEAFVWGMFVLLLSFVFVRSYTWYTLPGLALLAVAWPYRRRAIVVMYAICAAWFVVHTII